MDSDASQVTALVKVKLANNGQSRRELAKLLAISASYLSQLMGGEKAWGSLSILKFRALARYLGMSLVRCMIIAGVLEPGDLTLRPEDFNDEVNLAIKYVSSSSIAAEFGLTGADFQALEQPVQLLLISLFEHSQGVKLLPEKVSDQKLAFEVKSHTLA